MIKKFLERNLKMYFRDRVSVFFSLLAVLIVIVLYILFLAQMQIDSVAENTNGLISDDKISYLINSWILAGLLSITTVTSTLGAYGTIVIDYEKRKIMDFKSSPLHNMVYPAGSVLSTFVVGIIISIISLAVYSTYIVISTGYMFTVLQMIKCFGLICFASLMNACLMGFIVSFLKTSSAFSAVSLVIGTMIGFLNGLYVPMGTLPESVQTVLKCLPFGHIAALFRQVLMNDSIKVCFKGMEKKVINDYKVNYGVCVEWGDKKISTVTSIIFIFSVLIIMLILFLFNYNRKKKEI